MLEIKNKIFLSSILALLISTNSLAEDGKVFTRDWFSHNILKWNNYKNLFDGLENKRCLEIGSFEGRSTLYLVENYCNGKNSYVDSIDTWEGSSEHSPADKKDLYDRFVNNLKPYIENHKVNIYRGASSDMLMKLISEVREGKREKYDFIYIDASHTAKDVLMDGVLSWELLKNGGLMFFDDYNWAPNSEKPWYTPKPGIDGFLNSYFTMYEILEKNYQVHIKKTVD